MPLFETPLPSVALATMLGALGMIGIVLIFRWFFFRRHHALRVAQSQKLIQHLQQSIIREHNDRHRSTLLATYCLSITLVPREADRAPAFEWLLRYALDHHTVLPILKDNINDGDALRAAIRDMQSELDLRMHGERPNLVAISLLNFMNDPARKVHDLMRSTRTSTMVPPRH